MGCVNGLDPDRLREALFGMDLAAALKRIRGSGWHVAVHNDYSLNGEWHTFWLFTKRGTAGELDQAVKGEGKTDEEALGQVLQRIGSIQDILRDVHKVS